MSRRNYSSTAVRTTLSAPITSIATSLVVVTASGYPSPVFTIIVDADTVNEEVMTVTNVSGTTFTVTRAQEGTTGVAHSAGSSVQHGVSARDFDEPNAFINGTGFISPTIIDTKGDLLVGTADNTLDRLGVGSNGYVLTTDSAETSGLKWALAAAGATGGGTDQVFYENDVAVTTSYTISTDKNAGTFGPVSIGSGATVTIPTGSVWVIA